jgi:hypothetical protein
VSDSTRDTTGRMEVVPTVTSEGPTYCVDSPSLARRLKALELLDWLENRAEWWRVEMWLKEPTSLVCFDGSGSLVTTKAVFLDEEKALVLHALRHYATCPVPSAPN